MQRDAAVVDAKTTMHTPPLGSFRPSHLRTTSLAKAFELAKDEILALPADAVAPPDIDVPRSARLVLGAAKRLVTLLPELAKLDGFDLRPVRRLRFYAGAALYTHIASLVPGRTDAKLVALRERAFVLFVQAHQRCNVGVMQLRWHEGDAVVFLPALQRRRGASGGGARVERAPTPAVPSEEVTMS